MAGEVEIINPDKLPAQFILDEIKQFEHEKNRRVIKAEFTDLGDGNCKEKFWVQRVDFQRLRRITGYLVGDVSRFNNAKRAEERDRVKHSY